MDKKYYTTGEVAQICHVSAATIFRAIVNKSLRAAKTPGGHFRVSSDDLDHFLKKSNLAPEKETRNARILIVEDNPVELRFFKRALEREKSFEINTTGSGYEAGFLTQSLKPDLILLDILLADSDGREVARLIRADNELKHTKIIAITGAKDAKIIKDLVSTHFDSFIFKPIDPDELLTKVRRLLG